MKDVAIVSSATQFTSTKGRQYLLVFCEFLYIPKLFHTLINPNKLFHFQTQVQYNPYAMDPMIIIIPDGNFISCLESKGINIFINTWSPTQEDLASLPHIQLTLQQRWEPHNIAFLETNYCVKEEMESRKFSSIAKNFRQSLEDTRDTTAVDEEDNIFNTKELNRIIVASVQVAGTQANENEEITIDESRRVAELFTIKKIAETIQNNKQGNNVT